jgi:DNA-binding NtrC family response regulator
VPEDTVTQALAQAGLAPYSREGAAPRGPGVLVFTEITPRLCDHLREVSRSGVERVLAVAAIRLALNAGGAWRLLQAGASDVLCWDDSPDPVGRVVARFERWRQVDLLVGSAAVKDCLVGQSPPWTACLRRLVEVAQFTDAAVLLTGESGTGKELAARLIHTLDQRADKRDLVVLDCTTVVPELSGSEFFGHERGAFTGAVAARDGAFALADGGTLFLDEVGELPPTLQAELLRVVQERAYKRVGSNTWQHTNFRLVCATNRDLLQEEAKGWFRRDFYYRIATCVCKLPPLRERIEDIIPLVQHFLRQLLGVGPCPELDEPVRDYFLRRPYPGNVRDLKQLVARIAFRHVGPGPITVGDLDEEERPPIEPGPADWYAGPFEAAIRRALSLGVGLKEISRAAENAAIRIAIGDEGGNLRRAAGRLGVTDRALQMRRAAHRQDDAPSAATKPDERRGDSNRELFAGPRVAPAAHRAAGDGNCARAPARPRANAAEQA